MRTLIITWLLPMLFLPSTLGAQDARSKDRKRAFAVRVPEGSIRVDGRLDEEAWAEATPIMDFVQKEPNEGAQPAENMEVRFVYNSGGLYVGARMYKEPGSAIQAPMGRRDRGEQSEHVLVALDTFLDRRTAYVFGVTASGVRLDRFHPRDDEGIFDEGFDPVWQARTQVDEQGWTAELWIPFSQLRFNAGTEQVWGLNVRRFTPTLDEEDYWIPVPRTVTAWSSRFGNLEGLEGLTSNRRVEVLPYVAGFSTITGNSDPLNPFDRGGNLESQVGLDLKIGVGTEPDPGCDVQSGLWAGRGRSGGGESFCQRDDIPRETALFHRGCTPDELHRCHQLLPLTPHRCSAGRTGQWRLRRLSAGGHHPGRGENSRVGFPRERL